MNLMGAKKGNGKTTSVSIAINVLAMLFLIMAREPYAAVLAFVLLAMKIRIVIATNLRGNTEV